MKKIKEIIPVFLILFLLFACSNDSVREEARLNGVQATPEVLTENTYSSDLLNAKSWRSGHYNDIIKRLYLEAVSKNQKLKELNQKIEQIREDQYEILDPFKTYQQTNIEYLDAANAYVNTIQDSIQKSAMQIFFKDFKKAYSDQILSHEKIDTSLYEKAADLESQLLILQLIVSADMMKNYQKNELPAIAPLEKLVREYDALIQSTKDFYQK